MEHIKKGWGAYVQKLQQIAVRQNGYAIIHSRLLVDDNGEPVFWMEPRMERIEPMRGSKEFLSQVLGMLDRSNNS